MDDLCLKMIVNTKKIARKETQDDINTSRLHKAFQILEETALRNKHTRSNIDNFSDYLMHITPNIISDFTKINNGKKD